MRKTKSPAKKKTQLQVAQETINLPPILARPAVYVLTAITDFKGAIITHPGGEPATLRSIAVRSLMEPCEQPGISKSLAAMRAFHLADRINRENNVILNEEDATLIKNHIAAFREWNNLVIGRCCEIIDGRSPINEPTASDPN